MSGRASVGSGTARGISTGVRGDKKVCTLCHAVDPEEGDTDSFVADINIVCLACHDIPEHPVGSPARRVAILTSRVPPGIA